MELESKAETVYNNFNRDRSLRLLLLNIAIDISCYLIQGFFFWKERSDDVCSRSKLWKMDSDSRGTYDGVSRILAVPVSMWYKTPRTRQLSTRRAVKVVRLL